MNGKEQLEVQWDAPESFALKIESTADGDRQSREQAEKEQARIEAEKLQRRLL